MIEHANSFKVGDKCFLTLEEAQKFELTKLIPVDNAGTVNIGPEWFLKNKDVIVDILTLTPNSKPKARKINGGTKVRGKKILITNAPLNTVSPGSANLSDSLVEADKLKQLISTSENHSVTPTSKVAVVNNQ